MAVEKIKVICGECRHTLRHGACLCRPIPYGDYVEPLDLVQPMTLRNSAAFVLITLATACAVMVAYLATRS